jgi:hypothetical protein
MGRGRGGPGGGRGGGVSGRQMGRPWRTPALGVLFCGGARGGRAAAGERRYSVCWDGRGGAAAAGPLPLRLPPPDSGAVPRSLRRPGPEAAARRLTRRDPNHAPPHTHLPPTTPPPTPADHCRGGGARGGGGGGTGGGQAQGGGAAAGDAADRQGAPTPRSDSAPASAARLRREPLARARPPVCPRACSASQPGQAGGCADGGFSAWPLRGLLCAAGRKPSQVGLLPQVIAEQEAAQEAAAKAMPLVGGCAWPAVHARLQCAAMSPSRAACSWSRPSGRLYRRVICRPPSSPLPNSTRPKPDPV